MRSKTVLTDIFLPNHITKLNTFPIPIAAPAEAIVAAPAPIDFAPDNEIEVIQDVAGA